MVSDLPAPLIPAEIDLRQLPWFPILRRRLFTSHFHTHATNEEWRAGVTLWIKSYDQSPSGSLPNDDGELWRLAAVKGNARTWRRIKPMVLHGWVLCSDGRFYHPLIAELVTEAKFGAKFEKVSGKLNVNGGSFPSPFPPNPLTPVIRNYSLRAQAREGQKNGEGGQPGSAGPKPVAPKILGHAEGCMCGNCERWASLQRRTATGGD